MELTALAIILFILSNAFLLSKTKDQRPKTQDPRPMTSKSRTLTLFLRNRLIRFICFFFARPYSVRIFKASSIILRYFQGLGSGSTLERSGELHFLRKTLLSIPHKPICVDVGVNLGLYSGEIKRVREDAKIIGFEASSSTSDQAIVNLSLHSDVEILNIGLSDCERLMTLKSPAQNSGVATFHEHYNHSYSSSETVSCTTLDKFAINSGLCYIDILKVDVEGHELNVLMGSIELLRSNSIAFIQFDAGMAISSNQTFYHFWKLFRPLNYTLYRLLPYGFLRIDQYDEYDECTWPTIYIAISNSIPNIQFLKHGFRL
jgi:FkbM family methyltransferase